MHNLYALSLLLILTLSSLTMAETLASTQKPSTPEFTVKFIDSSYDVPDSSSIDPYTGQTIITPAEHVDNRTIEVKVKNQPFTPYVDDESSFAIKLYYNIRVRGYFGGNWTEVFSVDNPHPVQSNSDYTIISLPLGGNVGPFASLPTNSSSQIDFQVEAMIGYFSRTVGFASWYFAGEESDWSNTQTISIGAGVPSGTPNASAITPAPTLTPYMSGSQSTVLFGLDWLQLVLVVLSAVVVLLAFMVVLLRKRAMR